jgi:hypothetical protein
MTLIQKTIRKKAKSLSGTIKKNKGLKAGERKKQASRVLSEAEKSIESIEIKRTGNGIKPGAVCLICGGKVTTGNYRILGYKNTEPVIRHSICYPGSPRWLASTIGQESAYRKYFEQETEDLKTEGQKYFDLVANKYLNNSSEENDVKDEDLGEQIEKILF